MQHPLGLTGRSFPQTLVSTYFNTNYNALHILCYSVYDFQSQTKQFLNTTRYKHWPPFCAEEENGGSSNFTSQYAFMTCTQEKLTLSAYRSSLMMQRKSDARTHAHKRTTAGNNRNWLPLHFVPRLPKGKTSELKVWATPQSDLYFTSYTNIFCEELFLKLINKFKSQDVTSN